ncbi:MAG TPA: YkgJ family cysteine cluster protein [Spirochaetota bacterium]|nr:YkgJ family cysteine cluster protein [Spirochaetota bacterium]HRZ29048.1 YkgJ family cysteine cluster protein [Spirochaetota bacterium]HSA16694.1 YkgJ family cysteine cluster protein [Spirochaetota bacterium]
MNKTEEFKGISELIDLYREMDEMIEAFIDDTGIICPPSCGTCCATSAKNIEVSVFEVMPLALDLWDRDEAEAVLDLLAGSADDGCCVFYNAEIPEGAPGHCSVHDLRPLVCRLFGYYSRYDKYGRIRNCICPKMTSPRPGAAGEITQLPVMTEFAIRAASLNPGYGAARIPLNSALLEALSIVGMKRSYCSGSGFGG